MNETLGIIGAGNMAEAIVRGVIRSGLVAPGQIIVADVSAERRRFFESELQVHAVEANAEIAGRAGLLLLSVKPQQMETALAGIRDAVAPHTLIISIAAGISSAYIQQRLEPGHPWRVIRAMPNTPMLVGEGMVAVARGRHATADDAALAMRIFESAAAVIEVPEDLIDAVTAVSGSGPAYVFYLVEKMIDAAVALGLQPEQARLLASRTAMGAARMLVTSEDSPQELRRKVTSPGGTTEAAITHLESRAAGQAIVEAIKAAHRRSKELGR